MREETSKNEGEDATTAEEFTCNSCGSLTDTGYFYCEKCHRMQQSRYRKECEEKEKEFNEDNQNNRGGCNGKD